MTFKFGDNLIINVSLSILSSVIVGGGRAMATPTKPKYWVVDFLFRLKHNWGRNWAVIYTTWNIQQNLTSKYCFLFCTYNPDLRNNCILLSEDFSINNDEW